MEGNRIPEKCDPHSKVVPHSLKRWLHRKENVLPGQPLYPLSPAVQIFTDASKEGWCAHFREHTAKGTWSLPESKLHINYLELKGGEGGLLGPKIVPEPLFKQDSSCSDQQHHSGRYINKEGGMRSGSLCDLLWRILTWCSRKWVTLTVSPTHSRLAESGCRHAIQARPDRPNRIPEVL